MERDCESVAASLRLKVSRVAALVVAMSQMVDTLPIDGPIAEHIQTLASAAEEWAADAISEADQITQLVTVEIPA